MESKQLSVYLNKLTLLAKKGQQECVAEFAATLAVGALEMLAPLEDQLAALPGELLEPCKKVIGDSSIATANLATVAAPRLAIFTLHPGPHGGDSTPQLEWKRTVLLERVRVKKEEDRESRAKARLLFVVRFEDGEEWPGRELVGQWLNLTGMNPTRPQDAGPPAARPALQGPNAART